MSTFNERFNIAFKKSGLSQHQLAKLVKVSQPSIKKLVSGESKTFRKMPELANALNVDFVWLSTGDGDHETDHLIKNNNHVGRNGFFVEVLSVTASAGTGYLNSDVRQVIKLIEYDSEQAVLLFNGVSASHLKVLNISGDSMQGTFENGDSLFVNVTINEFKSDGIYVFTFGRSLYVKRLQLIKDKILVISDNKTYTDWWIEENEMDQLYIHGKVMLSQSMQLRKHG